MGYQQLIEPRPLPSRIEESPLESRRYGQRIGRLELGVEEGSHPEVVRDLIISSELDLVVLRYPADRVDWFSRLLHPSYTLLHADTLMYYEREVAPSDRDVSPGPWSFCQPGPDEHSRIRRLVRSIFQGYTSHYAANPHLPPGDLTEGYAEWACAYTGQDDRTCFILSGDGEDVGLVTVNRVGGIAEIALIGTADEARGRGVATALMRQAQAWAAGQGAGLIVISTQAHNTRVQRVWARLGYRPVLALTTVHALMARA